MKQIITIEIPGKPIAKKRPKFSTRGKFVRAYNDQETEESLFLHHVGEQVSKILEGPLAIVLHFHMPRPKGHFGTGRNAGKLKAKAPEHHTSKPDVDNLEKFVLDCLNGVAWNDDAQIVSSTKRKFYTEGKPKTEIIIMPA